MSSSEMRARGDHNAATIGKRPPPSRPGRATFVHLDLGIGGAERLVVDTAMALKNLGFSVDFVTSHHDRTHCFPETQRDLPVTVVGDWLPRSIFGKCYVICSIIRMIYLALYLLWTRRGVSLKPEFIFVDQVAQCVPFLRLLRVPVLFYCHHPDCLLVQKKNTYRNIYRWPIDRLEQLSTSLADLVVVNSRYTERVFRKTFPQLNTTKLEVLYPTVNFSLYDSPLEGDLNDLPLMKSARTTFLSLNRYERKKDIPLALKAFAYVISQGEADVHLIIAGGYDEAVTENVEHFQELQELAKRLNVAEKVTFLRSPSDRRKQLLLHYCSGVLYTPKNEHFGIVPLEAMYMRRPVIAANSGGPLETIENGRTGYLCEATQEAFGEAMLRIIRDRDLVSELGEEGRRRVTALFSMEAFQRGLQNLLSQMLPQMDSSRKLC